MTFCARSNEQAFPLKMERKLAPAAPPTAPSALWPVTHSRPALKGRKAYPFQMSKWGCSPITFVKLAKSGQYWIERFKQELKTHGYCSLNE